MTPPVSALTVLILCVFLFITRLIPGSFTAVMGCILMYLARACDFSTAFSGFSSSVFLLVAGSMIVGTAIQQTGLAKLIALRCIKLSGGSEKRFILYAAISAGILSAFIANTAVVACFLPIIESVALSGMGTRKNMTMAITFGAIYGGSLTLVGSTPQPVANGILESITGTSAGMYDYLGPGLCVFIAFILYTQLFGYDLGIKIWGGREDDIADASSNTVQDFSYSKRKIIAMLLIFAGMVISYTFQVVPVAVTAMTAGLLCVMLRLCTEEQVYKGMAWAPLIMLGGTIGIAAGLNASGAGEYIVKAMMSLLSEDSSPLRVFAAFVIITTIISNFCSNAATVIMILPLAMGACISKGWNPITFAVGIVIAASQTCATPIAHTPVTMTLVAGYKFSDYFRYNIIMNIIAISIVIFATPLFLPF